MMVQFDLLWTLFEWKDTTQNQRAFATLVNFQRLFVQHLSLGWFLGGTCHLVVATSVLSNLIWSPLGWPSCGSQGPHKTICDDSWCDCSRSLWELLNSLWKEDFIYWFKCRLSWGPHGEGCYCGSESLSFALKAVLSILSVSKNGKLFWYWSRKELLAEPTN